MIRKAHKPNCQCCFCKSKRKEYAGKNNPMFGKFGKDNPNYESKRIQTQKDNISKSHIGLKATQITKDKMSKSHTGEKSGMWRGKEYQRKDGRWFIWSNGIKYRRARYIAMQCLGRELTEEEIIHHINGNKEDDRPENLYVFETNGDHVRQHMLKCPPILTSNLFKRYNKLQSIINLLKSIIKSKEI